MLIETPGDDRLRSWEHKGATAKSCAKVANCTMEIVGRLRRRCSRHLAHDLSHLYLRAIHGSLVLSGDGRW
jgi:hypothetical protein